MGSIRRKGWLCAALMAVSLGACQGGSFSGSPEGVPIALESIDGAPAPVRTALIDELSTAASDRKVELVGASAEARYRVRGYLSTETSEGRTKVSYVWDVFDSQKRRLIGQIRGEEHRANASEHVPDGLGLAVLEKALPVLGAELHHPRGSRCRGGVGRRGELARVRAAGQRRDEDSPEQGQGHGQ